MARIQQDTAELIDQIFPGVKFQGHSEIHRSIARNLTVEIETRGQLRRFMAAVVHSNFPGVIYDMLRETFTGCEWLMESEEFSKLMMVDLYRGLKGLPNSESVGKIQNPRTGNVFHRMALRDGKIICGIRFWCSSWEGNVNLGFRFRIALLGEESEGKARVKARQKVAEAAAEYEPMMAELDIGEPTQEEVESARKLLRVDENVDEGEE